jgi:hypothetical protein
MKPMNFTTRILYVLCLGSMAALLVWSTPMPDPALLKTDSGQISRVIDDGNSRYTFEFNTSSGVELACHSLKGGFSSVIHWAERCPYGPLSEVGSQTLTIRYLENTPFEVINADGNPLIRLDAHRQARQASVCGALGLGMLAVIILFNRPKTGYFKTGSKQP